MKQQGKFIDLTGKTFGETYVIRRTENDSHRQASFLVRCSCGKETTVRGAALRSGLHTKCKSCSTPKERPSARLRPYEALYNTVKRKTTKREFSIDYEWFVTFCSTNTTCHYCKAPVNFSEYNIAKFGSRYQIDRKDNNVGYTAENTVCCCWRCNNAKGSKFTYEEWFGMTQYFRDKTE